MYIHDRHVITETRSTLTFSLTSNDYKCGNVMYFITYSGVGSGGAPGVGAPPLFNRAPADLALFPGRFVGGGQSGWERVYRARTIYNEL